jgi:zinc protease
MGRIIRSFTIALLCLLPLRAAAAIEVQEVTSPRGIKAWLVEEHSIPFVALEIRFRGGSALDLPGKRGATNLMVGLLEEGAGELDARGFAQAAEALAARFRYNVFDDTLSISAQMLTETRDEAVALLKSSITTPRFDQDAIDRVREQVLAGIRSAQTDPSSIAGDAFFLSAFGTHPYGSDRSGTLESVAGLDRDDIVTAFENVFALDRIYVSAVGDITADELGFLLDELLGGLPQTAAPLAERAEYGLTGEVEIIPFDTPQSVALFGHQGIKRDDPDYLAAYVVNEIFGGSGVKARLSEEVREKRGLTYGVGTFLQPLEYSELVLGQVRSDNDKIAQSIEVIRAEWEKIARGGVTQQELDDAKTYLTGAYALRFDGNATIARIMVGMQMSDQGVGYLRERNDLVNALTLEEVNRVAARLYDPAALHFVVVGQPVGLE